MIIHEVRQYMPPTGERRGKTLWRRFIVKNPEKLKFWTAMANRSGGYTVIKKREV